MQHVTNVMQGSHIKLLNDTIRGLFCTVFHQYRCPKRKHNWNAICQSKQEAYHIQLLAIKLEGTTSERHSWLKMKISNKFIIHYYCQVGSGHALNLWGRICKIETHDDNQLISLYLQDAQMRTITEQYPDLLLIMSI